MKDPKIFLTFIILIMASTLSGQDFKNFITVSGNKLMDGNKEFRFLSYNIPNLNYTEDELPFTTLDPFRLPTEFEIRDAFQTIKELGGRVIRIYTIPVKRKEQSAENCPAHVLAPGVFNEEAYKINDLMLALAHEYGIRIIFPIVNNWKWMGGRPQYAEFRGKTPADFWTDEQIINDVKKTIEYTLNRKNTITGVVYKDDKAILAWETGNELQSPPAWISTITACIKENDKNHLVMDGFYAINKITVLETSVEDPSVDILSSHHYETDPRETLENIKRNVEIIKGRKPLIIGEFGFQSTPGLEDAIDLIVNDHNISGGLIWSLRFHRQEGGFYWHSEPMGMGIYKAYHWPGFESGTIYDEKNFMTLMRKKSFEIQGLMEPPVSIPVKPRLLPINSVYEINWQGSVGAAFYYIERTEKQNGPWVTIASDLDDASLPYTSMFHDAGAKIGKEYYYRVVAGNNAGLSVPSDMVGPVMVKEQALVDNMSNYSIFYYYKDLIPDRGQDRKFKEDLNRFSCKQGSEMIYKIEGTPVSFQINAFQNSISSIISIQESVNGVDFTEIPTKTNLFSEVKNDYDSWLPVLYSSESINTDTKYIKIISNDVLQISRILIVYK